MGYLRELMAEEKAKEGSRIFPFLAIHLAHFLRTHAKDVAGARQASGVERAGREGREVYPSLSLPLLCLFMSPLSFSPLDLASCPMASRQVLDEALSQCPGVRSLVEAAVHFEELVGGPEVRRGGSFCVARNSDARTGTAGLLAAGLGC